MNRQIELFNKVDCFNCGQQIKSYKEIKKIKDNIYILCVRCAA